MLISPTSLANMATMSLFGASTWSSWRHRQTHNLGRYDLKQKNQDALRNTKTMVTLLCGSIVNSRFIYCFVFWIQLIRHCFKTFYCSGLCDVVHDSQKASFKMAADKNVFCFHANVSWQPHQYGQHVFVLLPNMTSHGQTHSKDKSAKLKTMPRQNVTSLQTIAQTMMQTIASPLYRCIEFPLLFHCF